MGTAEGSKAKRSRWMKAARKGWLPANSSERFQFAAVQVEKRCLVLKREINTEIYTQHCDRNV